MSHPYRQIEVEQIGDVYGLRLRRPRLEVGGLEEVITDIDRFMAETRCTNLVFSLGPEEPQCLYSIFLAKLVSLQKRLRAAGGGLIIAEAGDNVKRIFAACRLDDLFQFHPDRPAAFAALAQPPTS